MTVKIREVQTKKDARQFVDVQFDIYKGNKFWIPPVRKAEIKALFPDTNPAYDFCKAKFWLAFKDDKCAGRVGAIINDLYNEKAGEKIGRFSRLEMIDDNEVCETLIGTAESWIKEQGMTGIRGPLGFTNLDNQGLLIEGFDHLPSIASVYHHPYYHEHIEKLGFEKEADWLEFRLTVGEVPEKGLKMNELVKQRYGLKVINFTRTKEMQPYTDKLFEILNEAFAELPYVSFLNDKMIAYYKEKYFSFINPHFVKLVEDKTGNIIAFIIGVPSLSEAMQKANGSLFPFGFIHILKAMKKPEVLDLMLTGVLPHAQNMGAPAIFFTELQKECIKRNVHYMETTGMFETNTKAITHWKSYEHIQHKRRRCYIKMF
jgi:hypothetical protein